MTRLSIFGVFILFLSCSPKVKQTVKQNFQPLQDSESIIIFSKTDSSILEKGVVVGEIFIKDSGLTIDCSLETVLGIAKSKARLLGANVLMIYEHKLPNVLWSGCHQIKAKAIRLKDISEYEKEIIWHRDRKLKIQDFKGNKDHRPGIAATSSTFRYNGKSDVGINKPFALQVETVFDTRLSYFKTDEDSLFVLSHEQLHFDISELYARKFVKRITDEIKIYADLENKLNSLYREVGLELQAEHDRYDTAVYSDTTKQTTWNKIIKENIEALSEFEQKRVLVPYKLK